MNFYAIIRNIHVISAAIWLGIVVVVNFGLGPSVAREMTQGEVNILKLIFRRVRNLISISAFSTFVTGGILLWLQTKFSVVAMLESTRGTLILLAGGLGFVITLFHFFAESKVEQYLRNRMFGTTEGFVGYQGIEFIPKIGLLLIASIFVAMLIAVRGF
jgi:uncharacterized membrane protein